MPNKEIEESETIRFRVRKELKQKVEEAATLSGLTTTAFPKSVLNRSANEVLQRHQETILTDGDRDRLLHALDNAADSSKTLREAADLHKSLITK